MPVQQIGSHPYLPQSSVESCPVVPIHGSWVPWVHSSAMISCYDPRFHEPHCGLNFINALWLLRMWTCPEKKEQNRFASTWKWTRGQLPWPWPWVFWQSGMDAFGVSSPSWSDHRVCMPIDLKMAQISNHPEFCSLPKGSNIQGFHWISTNHWKYTIFSQRSASYSHIMIWWWYIFGCISCLRVVVPYSVWRQFLSIDSSILSTFEPIKMYNQYMWLFRIDIRISACISGPPQNN